jgi:hypothetical protein
MVVNATPRPLYLRERDPVPIVQKAGWAPGPERKGAVNLTLAGLGFTDRPARKESQYRLSYPGPHTECKAFKHNSTVMQICNIPFGKFLSPMQEMDSHLCGCGSVFSGPGKRRECF